MSGVFGRITDAVKDGVKNIKKPIVSDIFGEKSGNGLRCNKQI